MGQQVLLIVLGVIVTGIAVVVGISLFNQEQAPEKDRQSVYNEESINNDLKNQQEKFPQQRIIYARYKPIIKQRYGKKGVYYRIFYLVNYEWEVVRHQNYTYL